MMMNSLTFSLSNIESSANAIFYFCFGAVFIICIYLFMNANTTTHPQKEVDNEAYSYKFYMNLFLLNRKVSVLYF